MSYRDIELPVPRGHRKITQARSFRSRLADVYISSYVLSARCLNPKDKLIYLGSLAATGQLLADCGYTRKDINALVQYL